MWTLIAKQRDTAFRELDESRIAEFEARAQFDIACQILSQTEAALEETLRELAKSDARTLRLVRPWHPEPPEAA